MKLEYKGRSPSSRRPSSCVFRLGEINKNFHKSVLLIHPVRDLTFTLVIQVGFSVRIEAISAVSSTRGSGYTTWSRHIASGCLHPNTFYRIRRKSWSKVWGIILEVLGAAGWEHVGPDIPASHSGVQEVEKRGCHRDAIIVWAGSGTGSCKTSARSLKKKFI